MIHVQIASQVTPQGVQGVRWVLVEPALPWPDGAPAATPPAPADPPPATASPVADGLRLGALKALAVALGLGAALWTAAVQIGPPRVVVAPAPAAAPAQSNPAPVAPHATPAAMPNPAVQPSTTVPLAPLVPSPAPAASQAPAAPASGPAPTAPDNPSRLTASLS